MTVRQKLSYVQQLIKFELLLLLVFIPIILLKERFTTAEHVGFGNGFTAYLFVVILAPVVEEVIFRYILRFSKSVAALVVSVTCLFCS